MTSKHECVGLRQLAMTHLRLHDDLLVPWVFDQEILQQLLRPGVLPPELVTDVHSWLIDRKFQKLWQCDALIQLLSSRCFMCDYRGHGTDLQIRLLVEHHCQERGLMMFVQQILRLLPVPMAISPGCCFCGMARDDLRAHLIACPTLIQISSLIALPIHERFWLGSHGGRFHGAIIGGAPRLGPGGHTGKRSGSIQESQTRVKQARSADGGQGAPSTRSHSSHGSPDAPARPGSADERNAGYIHSLLGSKPRGQHSTAAVGSSAMDGSQGEDQHPPHLPDPCTSAGTATQASEVDGLPRSRPTEDHHGEERHFAGGPDMAVHSMGSGQQEACAVQDENAMTMAAAQELLEELLTLVKEEGAVQRFHSLSKQESTKSQPWKLQVGQRNDRLHHLLTTSCHLSLWQIAGIQMKPHTLKASPLAVKVKDMLQSL